MGKNWITIGLITVLPVLGSACGGSIIEREPAGSSSNDLADTDGAQIIPLPEERDDGDGGSEPLYLQRVGAVGYDGVATVTVLTSKKLRLRFTPGVQDEFVADTGVSPIYSRLGVYVSVGSASHSTGMLSNSAYEESTSSDILDFSSKVRSFPCVNGKSSDNCKREITIKVTHPSYDYWCINFGLYCRYTKVHESHPWNGTLEIETDSTLEIAE